MKTNNLTLLFTPFISAFHLRKVELEGQENLKKLTLWKNELTNVDALSQCRLLEDVNLRENNIVDVSALASLPYLKRLDIAQNPISDMSKLKEKANLNLIC